MVRPERFELPTYCSGGNRSIHLSYGRPTSVYMGGLRSINVRIAQAVGLSAAVFCPQSREPSSVIT